MNQNQNEIPEVVEKDDLDNAKFSADEAGLTTSFDKSDEIQFTEGGPEGAHIVSQDEFWDGVKNADQTPREVASAVPTDVPEPDQTPEEEYQAGK